MLKLFLLFNFLKISDFFDSTKTRTSLLLENKINKKRDILVFVESKKSEIFKKLKRRNNFNKELYKKFKNIQLPISYKKKKSHYVIKNNFNLLSLKNNVKLLKNRILNERNNT